MTSGRVGVLRRSDLAARRPYLSSRNEQSLADGEIFRVANMLFVRLENIFPMFRRVIKLSGNRKERVARLDHIGLAWLS